MENVNNVIGLIKTAEKCRVLLNGIAGGAKLNYNKTGMRFDDDSIDVLFKAIFPDEYKETLERLLEEDQKEAEA